MAIRRSCRGLWTDVSFALLDSGERLVFTVELFGRHKRVVTGCSALSLVRERPWYRLDYNRSDKPGTIALQTPELEGNDFISLFCEIGHTGMAGHVVQQVQTLGFSGL